MQHKIKEFFLASWAIDNRTAVYIITILITVFGLITYNGLPKENFPEVVVPTMFVNTIYPGTSPADIENLVTRPIEKEIKSISGVKKITSNSVQDFSNVIVEFNTDVDVAEAKQKVKDAVDKAGPELPKDLLTAPSVMEIDFSEFPIMFINVSGNYDLDKLKYFAEILKDKIESLKEITRVDMLGALEREIQVNVNTASMEAAQISTDDIARAISAENVTLSGGKIEMNKTDRTIRIKGEFESVDDIRNVMIRSMSGANLRLSEIAEIKDGYEERKSFARFNGENVITLNIIKRSGENLVEAADKIKDYIKELRKEGKFPADLSTSISGDQSMKTKSMLNDLVNSIIIGFILVVIVLMFFMGPTNAVFVGLSVPIAVFMSFLIMPGIDFTLNLMVLFSILFALGIIVDDAIVVVENTYRMMHENKGKMSMKQAAKLAAGEVFLPVLSGTATTVAPFFPLAFWPGIVGKFMFYLPITLILTLSASLIAAFLINPVFAVDFMKAEEKDAHKVSFGKAFRKLKFTTVLFFAVAALFYFLGTGRGSTYFGLGNFTLFLLFILYLNQLLFKRLVNGFENGLLPVFMNGYERILKWVVRGKNPYILMGGLVVLLIVSIQILGMRQPKVVFFPNGEPNSISVYMSLPIGTSISVTDSITKSLEKKVQAVLGENNPIVESMISNVGIAAGDPMEQDRSVTPHRGKVTVTFVEFSKRNGVSSRSFLEPLRDAVRGIPGAEISVEAERMGPPVGKPVNIEVRGEDFTQIIQTSEQLKRYLDSIQVGGVDELKSDLQKENPEIMVNINRERALREGLYTGQLGSEIRTAIFGKEMAKYRENEDEFPIMLRYNEDLRNNIDALINLKITYRDMNMMGQVRQVPLSSVAEIEYSSTFGGIRRKNQKRVVTISSGVLVGFNEQNVIKNVERIMNNFPRPEGIEIKMTGQQEDQAESSAFLGLAGILAMGMIFLILVIQFNSISRPIIIISEVFFSMIGVFLGFGLSGMEISIVMTGFGIIGLAGIVVKNGILMIEYMDTLRSRGHRTRKAIVEASKLRIKPVLLTASSTVLGLLAMAVGFNNDFGGLFTSFAPHIFFGGDNIVFFGPLSWTIIFGLSFATVITLIMVPAMYLLSIIWKIKLLRWWNRGTN